MGLKNALKRPLKGTLRGVALFDSVDEYLEKNPLTEDEVASGRALRVVRARWAGAGQAFFAYSVLHMCAEAPRNACPQIRQVGIMAPVAPIKEQFTLPYELREVPTENGNFVTWAVGEAEVVLPKAARFFALECEGARTKVGIIQCRNLQHAFFAEISNAIANEEKYKKWFLDNRNSFALDIPDGGPLMSIVMPAYNTPEDYLRQAIDSVRAQLYPKWELVIVNASPENEGMENVIAQCADERIHVVKQPENGGIVGNTNLGLRFCTGDYVSFLDHDDFVEPEALLLYVNAIKEAERQGETVDLLYCDEDFFEEGKTFHHPLFKPTLNMDLLLSNNYIIHWLTVNRRVIDRFGMSPEGSEGSQDYDITFKAIESGGKVIHVPRVMYHWRFHEGSTSADPLSKPYAQRSSVRVIQHYLETQGLAAKVTREPKFSTYRALCQPETGLSVDCFAIGGSPSEGLTQAAREYAEMGGKIAIKRLEGDTPSVRNRALRESAADIVAFLPADVARFDDDIEAAFEYLGEDAVRDEVEQCHNAFAIMLGYFSCKEVAALSPRVIRDDGLAEYENIIIRPDGALLCLNRFLPRWDEGYLGRAARPYDASVVYAPAVFLRRECVLAAGGLDESYETVDYALADLCLKLREQELLNVYSPFAVLHRSVFRTQFGMTLNPLADDDRALFVEKWGAVFEQGDPSHNPNFDPYSPYYLLRED